MGGNVFRCCGKSGKVAVRIVATIDIILAISIALSGMIVTLAIVPGNLLPGAKEVKYKHSPQLVETLLLIVFFFLESCLCTLLFNGILKRKVSFLENWIQIRTLLLCVFVFSFLFWLMGAINNSEIIFGGLASLIFVLYRVYTLLIVKYYQNELITKGEKEEIEMTVLNLSSI